MNNQTTTAAGRRAASNLYQAKFSQVRKRQEEEVAEVIDREYAPFVAAVRAVVEVIEHDTIEPDGCYTRINTTHLEQALATLRAELDKMTKGTP